VTQLAGQVGEYRIQLADFSHLPTRCKFIAMMPQWDFLNFLAVNATRYPTFKLLMNSEVINLLEGRKRIVGAVADTPEGPLEVRAHLTVQLTDEALSCATRGFKSRVRSTYRRALVSDRKTTRRSEWNTRTNCFRQDHGDVE
jgi:2-polyprenyl-6-methoxyphenol hydroxylase-like FAD-dependent oxidoreductase